MSDVPQPMSPTAIILLFFLSRPYARHAAVGSLMILRTFRPAIFPASLVAWRSASPKYAGTVITASVIVSPVNASASAFSLARTMDEISSGEYFFPLISTHANPFLPSVILYARTFATSCTWLYFFPIRRFTEWMTVRGFMIAWRFAIFPTVLVPSFSKETTDGVVMSPSAFGMMVVCPFS